MPTSHHRTNFLTMAPTQGRAKHCQLTLKLTAIEITKWFERGSHAQQFKHELSEGF